jgi:hypothetical protein
MMRWRQIASLLLLALGLSRLAAAQETQALGQTFNAPKANVEQALKDLNVYQSGRLPFLDGFVGAQEQPLANFQRAYYQYTIHVTQSSDSEVSVSVNAKISAWYEDKDAAKSGYRDLPSNGRLEADLLDRLRARLRKNLADAEASRPPLVSRKLLGIQEPDAPAVPDAPGAAASAPSFKSVAPGIATTSSAPSDASQDARYQRLLGEESILNSILAAQQHPDDLVAVKSAHTRITAAPSETAKVVMYADAQDEFQLLKEEGDWVHIQIAGPNRGWVRRSQVELVGTVGSAGKTAAAVPEQPEAAAPSGDAFHQTKQETSTFPGDWAPLRGKNVKIVWVQPSGKSTQKARLTYVESIFKQQAPQLSTASGVAGVVVVFDAVEGGMAATTLAGLQQWSSGSLSDAAFLKQCWFDPADAFTASASR